MNRETIYQKDDNPIRIEPMSNGCFIGELANGKLTNLIPIEKQSIPAMIDALKKFVE